MNEINVHVLDTPEKWDLSYTNPEKWGHILLPEKRANHILGSAEKGGHSTRISVLCHILEVTPHTHDSPV